MLALVLVAFVSTVASRAHAQEQPAAQPSQKTSEAAKEQPAQAASEPASQLKTGGKSESSEAGEENANLKYSASVQWIARKTGMSVHGANLLALSLNFAIIAIAVLWAVNKFVPGILRSRSASIQQALEEARAASQDANRRLADIETRLSQLGTEIGQMQAGAEKESAADEVRIQKAAEDDIRKVVLAAEQEIAAAAKQARRELSTHTAGLAIALARQQINVDANTDQVLVRSFASKLAGSSSKDDTGKEGR